MPQVTTQPLAGIKVLDVATVLAGPLCAQMLGDYGADVIKIEHPQRGDSFRTHGPSKDGHGLWWKSLSRNKRCLGLALNKPAGAAVFLELAAEADVVVEAFRPGTIEKWGIGPQVLLERNPRLVLARISGFGQTGPYASRAGFGTLAEAMSGFAAITGEPDGPPTLPPMGLADTLAGLTATSAVLTALFNRDRPGGSGRGQVVDVSLLEPMITAVGPGPIAYDQLGTLPVRSGSRSTSNAPRNAYRTKDDRWVAISTSATTVAERVMTLIGHPEVIEEHWFAQASGRAAHVELLDGLVAEWIADRLADDVLAAFDEAGAAAAPIYNAAELLNDPQVQALGMLAPVDDPDLGPIRMPAPLFRMSETPGSIRWTGRALGADSDEVLEEAGLGPERIAELRQQGVVV